MKSSLLTLVKCYLSLAFIGYIPKAPGTWGSLASIPLVIFLISNLNFAYCIIILLFVFATSCYLSQLVITSTRAKDPQWIVIDEFLGMFTGALIIFYFYGSLTYPITFILFVTFRFFDIKKIWPASSLDKIHNGFGVIADDIVSGIYAAMVTLIFLSI